MHKSLFSLLLFFSFQTYSQSYNLQSGINYFREDKYDESLNYLNKEIAQNPKESQAYFYNSLIYAAKDELAKALTQVNLAIQFNQTNDPLLCKYWQAKGNVYVKLKDTVKFENASRYYSLSQIRDLIKTKEDSGKFTFSFLGATLDAVDMAEKMNIRRDNSVYFEKSQMKDAVFNRMSDSIQNYMDRRRKGEDLKKF